MAISKELKEQILSDFHTGTFSQRELALNYSVGIGTISRLTKGLDAKNGTLVSECVDTTIKQNEIMEQIGTLNGTERNSVQKAVQEQIRHNKLINDNATKLAKKLNMMSDEIADPQDLKHLVDANDKLAITLKVADRHTPKQDISLNAQQNNQVNEIVGYEVKTIED